MPPAWFHVNDDGTGLLQRKQVLRDARFASTD
jgi:hypothetical protein